MPFKSKAQQGFLFAKNPKVAKEFAAETTKKDYAHLPAHLRKRAKRKDREKEAKGQ
jgi:hypothetical protein